MMKSDTAQRKLLLEVSGYLYSANELWLTTLILINLAHAKKCCT